eukprot:TRINITY_DN6421_c0_g1_i1.p1 TRINITY_DN6421_c0_g1~~TRINITY_DN6421_c0_g1_i1.p1  ORF type:complete len:216 (-),score=54.07 TRINITY_DN6421_c0_g1_i1:2-649(-)
MIYPANNTTQVGSTPSSTSASQTGSTPVSTVGSTSTPFTIAPPILPNNNTPFNRLLSVIESMDKRMRKLEKRPKSSTSSANKRLRAATAVTPSTPTPSSSTSTTTATNLAPTGGESQTFNSVRNEGEGEEFNFPSDDEVESSEVSGDEKDNFVNEKKQELPEFLKPFFQDILNIFEAPLTKERKEDILKSIPKSIIGIKTDVPVLIGEFSQRAKR